MVVINTMNKNKHQKGYASTMNVKINAEIF